MVLNVLIIFIFIILICRLFLILRFDFITNNQIKLLKFILGIYAFQLLLPLLQKGKTKEDRIIIKIVNWCLILFYLAIMVFFLVIRKRYG